MKNKKQILAMACALIALGNFAACGGGTTTETIDETKSQLRIGNFDGGVGTQWLNEAIDRFEELYKDKSFEDGKKGVQILVDRHKGVDINQFANQDIDIYFLENVNYYDAIATGNLLDITDMVTEKMTKFGEEESVEDKLYDNYKAYYKTPAGKYYGIPHYKGIYAINYDRGLWDEKRLFISADGEVNQKSTSKNLSKGPDGKAGTYDDGLPATYAEFYQVCDVMKNNAGVDPLVWSGQYQWYASGYLAALKADFEGAQADVPYSYNGETFDKLVKEIKADGTVVYDEPMAITEENGYEMFRSAGNYYPVKFMEGIIENQYYADMAFGAGNSHIATQGSFLLSKYAARTGQAKRIGMLIEGCWWANEAATYVQTMESQYGESFNDRNFAIMPYPKATQAEVGKPQTVLDTARSLSCINAHIDPRNIELAKTFLQFLQTDDELVKFLKCTSMTRNFKYEVPADVYAGLNTYAKSVADVLVNCEHVLPASSSDLYYRNASSFDVFGWFKFGGLEPTKLLEAGDQHKSAKQIFESVKARFDKTAWERMLGD